LIGIPKEDIEWNEEGEMIGYKGEGSIILICISIGLIFGMIFGTVFNTGVDTLAGSDEVVIETPNQLPDAENYCQKQGFDFGLYGGSNGIQGDTLSITCYPEEDGSHTTYYFDLNMTKIDTEVTTTR
jgi:hypothetical protein